MPDEFDETEDGCCAVMVHVQKLERFLLQEEEDGVE